VSRFLPTSRRLVQFSEGKSAAPGSIIVYIDGAFDVFHAGHVEILRVGAGFGGGVGGIGGVGCLRPIIRV
jgi:ethanolamine-phosphate cytidylyltransferase